MRFYLFDMIPKILENNLNSGRNYGTNGSKTSLAIGA